MQRCCHIQRSPLWILNLLTILLEQDPDSFQLYIRKWEQEWDLSFTMAKMCYSYPMRHPMPTGIRRPTINSKPLGTVHLRPCTFPTVPSVCCRCQEDEGTLLHISWSPRTHFSVTRIINKVTRLALHNISLTFLLHLPSSLKGQDEHFRQNWFY